MPFRLETKLKVPDARSVSKCGFFNSLISNKVSKADKSARYNKNIKISKVEIVDCYTVDAKLNTKQIHKACELLTNPLLETCISDQLPAKRYPLNANFDFAIEISFLPGVTDNVAHTAQETITDGTGYKFKEGEGVYSSVVYFIKFASKHPSLTLPIKGREIQTIANSLYNPLIQKATIKSLKKKFNSPYPPLLKRGGGVDFPPFGKSSLSSPPFVQRGGRGGYSNFHFPPNLPKVKLTASKKITKVNLNVSDEELVKLGKLGIKDNNPPHSPLTLRGEVGRRGPLALSLEYLKTIRNYFNQLKRQPTDVEIETLAQTWSEHCKHTIFADPIDNLKQGLYKTYIKGATEAIRKQKHKKDFCVSVFTDNAGGIIFDKNYLVTHKVETHNTPSALDPFGGSITGLVGVNRDCLGFGLGAKPVINTFGFCLAKPDDNTELFRDKKLEQPMLSARRIMDGVVAGINAGGNQSGIPTNSGFLYFDNRYRGKPLVFAGTVGLIPRKIKGKFSHHKQAQTGDLIVMVGGRVGLDGIHGATFSSEGLDKHSPATAVQIGDPITQKKMSDAICKEARDLNLFNSITDCGAGGLSSAIGEMAKESHGCLVKLEAVPVKYPGLAPWQIWISESQERMVLAVPPKKWKTFAKLMRARGVESSVIGQFTNTGNCEVKFGKQTVLDLDLNFLHNGRPIKNQTTRFKILPALRSLGVGGKTKQIPNPTLEIRNLKLEILALLSSPNLASTAFLNTQYDHEVQGGSVLKPLQGKERVNADATITKPLLDSPKGVVLSSALYPTYSELDPYQMAGCAIDTAIRQAVCVGGNPDYLALLDNFCWCSPDDPYRLWQLKETARGCYDFATAFGTPFISGKDSMHNDFKGFDDKGKTVKISIPPTLLISAIGVVDDVQKSISLDAKFPGDIIYILGKTNNEMGGSEYARMTNPNVVQANGLPVPRVDATENYRLYRAVYRAIQKNLIASSISLGRGGLVIALSKMLIAGNLGAKITLADAPGGWTENYQALFSESQGRIVVSVNPQKAEEFETLMSANIFAKLGEIQKKNNLMIMDKSNKKIIDLKISQLAKAYHSTFKNY